MVTMRITSRALRQIFLALYIFGVSPAPSGGLRIETRGGLGSESHLGYGLSMLSKASASEAVVSESPNLARPSIQLLSLGLRFTTPKGWTAEDYPQLNGVLLLSPVANDALKSSWRTRILVEIGKPQLGGDLSLLASNNAISILGPGTQWREVARKTIRHAQGFDYGWVEATQVRDPHALRDWRIVFRPKTGSDLIIITLSCARPLWDIERSSFEAFIEQIKLL